jgi:hypothetical protein
MRFRNNLICVYINKLVPLIDRIRFNNCLIFCHNSVLYSILCRTLSIACGESDAHFGNRTFASSCCIHLSLSLLHPTMKTDSVFGTFCSPASNISHKKYTANVIELCKYIVYILCSNKVLLQPEGRRQVQLTSHLLTTYKVTRRHIPVDHNLCLFINVISNSP